MSSPVRYCFVHDYPFWKIDSVEDLTTLLHRMTTIAKEENDRHTLLALQYSVCQVSGTAGFKMPEGKKVFSDDVFGLLKNEGGAWKVLASSVGATDVPYMCWWKAHGVAKTAFPEGMAADDCE